MKCNCSRLVNKKALITGASKGIGGEIAVSFAKEGADVVINYPSESQESNARQIAERAREVSPDSIDNTILIIKGDVSNEEEVEQMFTECERNIGDISVLVNNAGIYSMSPITQMSVDEWNAVMDVNLRGSFLTIRRALGPMLSGEMGAIINIASELAYIGDTNVSHYAASKGGIVSLTRAIAREAAPDVHVNAIAPGPISTDLLQQTPQEKLEEQLNIPAGRAGEPKEVAPTAVFLASDDASYYYGQVLSPSGGAIMK